MKEKHSGAGLSFVACMFIGAGIGLLFDRPEVGGCIGIGVGFLLMAIIRTKEIKTTPVTINLPKTFGKLILCVIGLLMITCGFCLLYEPALLYPYVVSIGIIAVGIIVFLSSLVKIEK